MHTEHSVEHGQLEESSFAVSEFLRIVNRRTIDGGSIDVA